MGIEEILVAIVALAAAGWLIRGWVAGAKKSASCGGCGCGCSGSASCKSRKK